MKRIVLDTNVLVSSVLGGTLDFIWTRWLAGQFRLVVSDDMIGEYYDVLNRPKLHLDRQTIERITAYVVHSADYVTPAEHVHLVERDRSDNKILEAAVAAQADCIVSGDHHLLQIKEFRSIPILSARDFLAWLEDA